MSIKAACRVVVKTNLATIGGLITVGDITVSTGDRVLLVGQTNKVQNGIYVAQVGTWSRASDMALTSTVDPGTSVWVIDGGDSKDRLSHWMITSPSSGTISVGVTAITFETTGSDTTRKVEYIYAPESTQVGVDGKYLKIHAGKSHSSDVTATPWHNIVMPMGLAGRSMNGESSMINFMYGDDRVNIPEFIAGEIGFMGNLNKALPLKPDQFNPDGYGRAQTPFYMRIHSGSREITAGEKYIPVGLRVQGQNDVVVESSYGTTQFGWVNSNTVGKNTALAKTDDGYLSNVGSLTYGCANPNGGVIKRIFGVRGTTVGTGTLELFKLPLTPSGYNYSVKAHITTYLQGDTRESRERACNCYSLNAGQAPLLTAFDATSNAPGIGSAADKLAFEAVVNNLVLKAYGTSGKTLAWSGFVEVLYSSPSGI
jgi:hypothetical protein